VNWKLKSAWSRGIFIILLTNCGFNAHSQSLFQGHYLPFALGFNSELFTDDFYGPTRYRTASAIAQLGWVEQQENYQNNLYLSGGYGLGSLDQPTSNDRHMQNIPASLHYSLRFKVAEADGQKHTFWFGLLNQNTFNYRINNRFGNSSTNVSGLFSYGLSGSYQLNAEAPNLFKKAITTRYGLQFDVNVPIGSYVLRPGYVTQMPNGDFGLSEHLFWGDFFHLNFRSALVIALSNGNQLRLIYNWDFVEVNKLHLYQQGRHQLFLGLYTPNYEVVQLHFSDFYFCSPGL